MLPTPKKNLLHIDSSITGEASLSRKLTRSIVDRFRAEYDVVYRDLAQDPLPHLAGRPGPSPVLEEFLAADVVVVGAPMYNFAIPSQLKAWIDALAVAGSTFSYSDKGPKGLCEGKRVIIASSRGGFYDGASPMDHQESYLRILFGFFGITDIEFVRAEGSAYGPEHREKAVAASLRQVEELAIHV